MPTSKRHRITKAWLEKNNSCALSKLIFKILFQRSTPMSEEAALLWIARGPSYQHTPTIDNNHRKLDLIHVALIKLGAKNLNLGRILVPLRVGPSTKLLRSLIQYLEKNYATVLTKDGMIHTRRLENKLTQSAACKFFDDVGRLLYKEKRSSQCCPECGKPAIPVKVAI